MFVVCRVFVASTERIKQGFTVVPALPDSSPCSSYDAGAPAGIMLAQKPDTHANRGGRVRNQMRVVI